MRTTVLKAGLCAALALACGLAGAGADSAAHASVLRQGTAHEALFDVAIDGAGRGISVGAGGAIFESADGGKTWTTKAAPVELSLLSVASVGDQQIAVGQRGLVLYREGDGAWKTSPAQTDQRLMDVQMNSVGHAYAVGSFGTILESTDAGENWTAQKVDWTRFSSDALEPHLYAVHVSEDGSALIAGEMGLILYRQAGSDDWLVRHAGDIEKHIGDASLFAMQIGADGVGYAVGQDGMMLKTQDGGGHWARMPSGTSEILLSVAAVPGKLLVGTLYGLRASVDDGRTWNDSAAAAVEGGFVSAISVAADRRSAVAVGNAGRIVRVRL